MTVEDFKNNKKVLYKLKEVSDILGIGVTTLKKYADNEKIKTIKIMNHLYVSSDEIVRILTEGLN